MTPEQEAKIAELAIEEQRAHEALTNYGMTNIYCMTGEEREKLAVYKAKADVRARKATAALQAAIQEAAYGSDAAPQREEGK